MKWYNFEKTWINIEKVDYIECYNNTYHDGTIGFVVLFYFKNHHVEIRLTPSVCNSEFEKIKTLMGVIDKNTDWTPGRCC